MTTDKPIPSTRVTRVTDMRTLPQLDDDATMLVVKNGICWKLDFGKLRKKTLDTVLEEVQQTIDEHAQNTESALSGIFQSIEQITQKNNNIQHTAADLSSNIYSYIDKLKQHYDLQLEQLSAIDDNIQSFCKKTANDMENAAFSKIRPDFNQLRKEFEEQERNICILSTDISKTDNAINAYKQKNAQAQQDIKSNIVAIKTELVESIEKTAQSNLAELTNLKNNIALSVDQIYKNLQNDRNTIALSVKNLKNDEVAIYNAQQQLSISLDVVEAKCLSSTKKIDDKFAAIKENFQDLSTHIQQLSTTNQQQPISGVESTRLDEVLQHINALEAKLYGITVNQEDENGAITEDVIENGDIQQLNSILKSLQTRVDMLEKQTNLIK